MALPAQVWDPVCTGIMEFLNGWALVPFLATCRAARNCQEQLALLRNVKEQVESLNAFLQITIERTHLRLPGFKPGALAAARLIPIDPLRALPGRNMWLLLDETYALNPRPATSEDFQAWLTDCIPNATGPTVHMGQMLRDMHGPGNALHGNPHLEALARILCLSPPPAYAPSWARAGQSPMLVNGVEATFHPAFLMAWGDCQGFPVLLFAHARVSILPSVVIFPSQHPWASGPRVTRG